MYASPPKTVFMKTVARCPSDTSSGAGTGTAPLRELKGDGKTDQDRVKTTRKRDSKTNGTYKSRAGGSEITSRSVLAKALLICLSNSLFPIYCPTLSRPLSFQMSETLEKVESTLPLSLIPPCL